MPSRTKPLVRALALAAWTALAGGTLSGCANEYTYTPPASEGGKQCVQQCQAAQGHCRAAQEQAALGARQQCEAATYAQVNQCEAETSAQYNQCEIAAQADYTACLKYAPDRAVCHRQACVKQICATPSCSQSPSYGFCDTEFRACYQNCGGVVGVLK